MKFILIIYSFATLVLSTSVNAAVIDFEPLAHNDSIVANHGSQYTQDGFQLDALSLTDFGSYGTSDTRSPNSTALFNNVFNGITQLSKIDGGAFNLLSIDLSKLGTPSGASVTFLTNTGHSQTFTLVGTVFVLETFNFDIGFHGVTDVHWSQVSPGHQFDNIVVSAVPVPAATWLFGSGLLCLFGVTRRKA